jgi:glucokinase
MPDMLILEYIGREYGSCWEFVRHFYREQFGADVSEAAIASAGLFREVHGYPVAGDLVMFQGATHCGVYYAGGVLHQPTKTAGVIYECADKPSAKPARILRFCGGPGTAGPV